MSKIIDTLNNPFKKERVRSSAQEEIAKIYLKVSDKSKNKKDKHDDCHENQQKGKTPKPRLVKISRM